MTMATVEVADHITGPWIVWQPAAGEKWEVTGPKQRNSERTFWRVIAECPTEEDAKQIVVALQIVAAARKWCAAEAARMEAPSWDLVAVEGSALCELRALLDGVATTGKP